MYVLAFVEKKVDKKKFILLIDDDITSLDLCAYLVEELGYEVERCTDGRRAIEFVREHTPDLVVVDLMMPEIDGQETVRQIRSLGLPYFPILAFTAVDDSELHAAVRSVGCDEVLTKPCRPDKLLRHIEELLRKKTETNLS